MRVLQRVVDSVTSDEESDGDSDDEGPRFKEVFSKNAKSVCNILCTWDCTKLWVQGRRNSAVSGDSCERREITTVL